MVVYNWPGTSVDIFLDYLFFAACLQYSIGYTLFSGSVFVHMWVRISWCTVMSSRQRMSSSFDPLYVQIAVFAQQTTFGFPLTGSKRF